MRTLPKFLWGVFALCGTGLSATAQVSPLADDDSGVKIYASVISPEQSKGIWTYGINEWSPKQISINHDIIATAGGFEADGIFYMNRYISMGGFEEMRTMSFYTDSWEVNDNYTTTNISYMATTMAYSYDRNEVYGCFINENRNGYNFVRWNRDYYYPKAVIRTLEKPWSGCAFASDGLLYALDVDGDLYAVEAVSGKMTLIGSTGIKATLEGDATIDTTTDTMYWSVANQGATDVESALYKVDIKTATATKLYDLVNCEQLCGMYILPVIPEVPDGAPVAATYQNTYVTPRLSFSGSSLKGTFTFKSPYYTKGGDVLPEDEQLTYVVKANGKQVATGQCARNTQVTVDLELEKSDNYYITVTTANSAGTSLPAAAENKFIGSDVPKAPSISSLKLDGSTVTLSWYAPTSTGLNGGTVDVSSCSYTVVRYPDMHVVAKDITDRTVTDELPTPDDYTEYHYVISTQVGEFEAPDAVSANIGYGPMPLPHTWTFTSSNSLNDWIFPATNKNEYGYNSYYGAMSIDGYQGLDDWAITSMVKARKGAVYPVAVTVKSDMYNAHTYKVAWGTEPTAEAMTNTAFEFSYKGEDEKEFTGELTTDITGAIYIGVYVYEESGYSESYIVKLDVGEGNVASAPAAPTDFTAVADATGAHKVTVSFTTPENDVDGEPLEGNNVLTGIVITRDENVIYSLQEGVSAGQKIEYVDEADDLTAGNHTYAAYALNAYGEGAKAEAEVFVGVGRPVAPTGVKMVEDGNTGNVTITWEPVTADVDGNTLPEGSVKYRVINLKQQTVGDNIESCEFTVENLVESGTQAFVQFGVYAVTESGQSEKMGATAYRPVGEPYNTPWNESFANKSLSSVLGSDYISGSEPWFFTDHYVDSPFDILPQDGDNGVAIFEVYGSALTGLITGKINLEGLENPAFTYYTYNYSEGWKNTLSLDIDRGDGNGFVTVQSNVVSETGPTGQWNKVVVLLKDYVGETVVFRITPSNPDLRIFTLDNLSVINYAEYNLSANRISAPIIADINKPFEIDVTVTNLGEKAVDSYTVELLKGDEVVATVNPSSLAPDATRVSTFEVTLGHTDGHYAEFTGRVVYDADQVESDNTTSTATVGIDVPVMPVVNDLSADFYNGVVNLSWSEPDLAAAKPAAFTETFENAESWSSTVEGWKFVDLDQTPVGGINTPNFPITGMQSWFVADGLWSGFPEGSNVAWESHSGNKHLASEYVQRGSTPVQSDDWAITPRLEGCSQVLSFFAKSFNATYTESIEVLASSGTTNTDDFVSVADFVDMPTVWTQYRVKLPEGTKYAAIRSRSKDKHFVFVDDVTFIPADGEPEELTISGYNIYRDGAKLNSTPVAECSFTDTAYDPDSRYFVTTVYTKGESAASNIVQATTGLSSVYSENDITISVRNRAICVEGLTDGNIKVVGVDGRIVADRQAQPAVRIEVGTGIYIVAAGPKVAKVIVK